MPKKSVKKFLISYTGKMPVEVDLEAAFLAGQKKAKKEKTSFAFERLAVDRSGSLTLRRNSTAIVSASELEAVKESLGDLQFKRFVVAHGEYVPRAERPKEEAAPEPKEESGPSDTPTPEPPTPTLTIKGKGKGKGKG